ncbi:hypothetical protein RBB50_011238 [Rhinocladiella similis]
MWPVWLIIVVAVVAAAIFTITGVLLAVRVERRRHRNILRSQHLARHLTASHRPNLSANDSNYSHVVLPDKNLNRVQMPYGIVFIGSNRRLAMEDEKDEPARPQVLQDPNELPLVRSNKRGIKRSFTGHSLHIPKTRRQKSIQKVMPCETAQNSPLSAIIELTDSEHTPPMVTEIADDACSSMATRKSERQFSIQWPLTVQKIRPDAAPTEVLSIAARASMLMRMGGGNAASANARPRLLIRAVSCSSTPSSPPEDSLPAISTSLHNHNHQFAQASRHEALNDNSRGTTSFDSEGLIFHNGIHSGIPNFNVDGGRSDLGLDARRKSPAPRLLAEPGRATIGTLRAVKPSLHSIHASFDMIDTSPLNSEDNSAPAIIVREESFKTIDASHWDSPLKLKVNKTRSGFNDRRSMVEPSRDAEWCAASDSLMASHCKEDSIRELRRPASVATANPLQWDLRGEFAKVRRSLSSLEGPKKATNARIVFELLIFLFRLPSRIGSTACQKCWKTSPFEQTGNLTDPSQSVDHSVR